MCLLIHAGIVSRNLPQKYTPKNVKIHMQQGYLPENIFTQNYCKVLNVQA